MTQPRQRFQPINFVFGMMMGAADIVPGISGGTVALILGVFERLVASIRAGASAVVSLVRGHPREARLRLGEVHWGMVVPLGAGILTALVIGARLIEPVLEAYPVQSRALFFGLILASIPVPWHRRFEHRRAHYGIAALGAVAAFLLTAIPPREVLNPSLILVFLAAAIAICAMILPGVSGSFLLLVMGMYTPTIQALNARDFAYIFVFVAGAGVGIGSFSKLLDHLLRHWHDVTMAALVGLMVGSLRAIWPYQDESRALLGPPSLGSLAVVTALALVGFLIVRALIRIGLAAEARNRESPGLPAAPVDTKKGAV